MTQVIRQKIIKTIITILSLAWGVTAVLTPTVVHSQENVCGIFKEQCGFGLETTPTSNEEAQRKTESTILKIANVLMFFAAIVCVVFIIIGGFILLTSSDGANAQKKGRTYIVNALVGLIIILFAKLIVEFTIRTTTGVINESK